MQIILSTLTSCEIWARFLYLGDIFHFQCHCVSVIVYLYIDILVLDDVFKCVFHESSEDKVIKIDNYFESHKVLDYIQSKIESSQCQNAVNFYE